ncbi:excalibur calcium-binding domain-containing protein [Streptomyces sp. NPDC048507]|uniref:excalibur calcium-binding domain-containing protein n=1 Tax=Streptomyces sp. NPDC048507 TaxID=3365560 RepID=UPI003720775D
MPHPTRKIHEGRAQRSRPGRPLSLAMAGVIAAITLTACTGGEAAKSTIDVAPYVHKGHVADCEAFKAQADAQAVLRADALDPNGLDRDGNGIACPKLPGPTDKKPVHRDFMTDLDGAPIIDPVTSPPPTSQQ